MCHISCSPELADMQESFLFVWFGFGVFKNLFKVFYE